MFAQKRDAHKKRRTTSVGGFTTCDLCGKRFRGDIGQVNRHKKQCHSDERPYICPFSPCTSAFKIKADMTKHWRAHFNLRSYKCDFCPKRFNYASTRSEHHRNVHRMIAPVGRTANKVRSKRKISSTNEPFSSNDSQPHNIVPAPSDVQRTSADKIRSPSGSAPNNDDGPASAADLLVESICNDDAEQEC
jgi:hypothetical protein